MWGISLTLNAEGGGSVVEVDGLLFERIVANEARFGRVVDLQLALNDGVEVAHLFGALGDSVLLFGECRIHTVVGVDLCGWSYQIRCYTLSQKQT